MKKIGILTSGGDCGGLNAVIKGAALTALHYDMEPWLIPNGYAGLYNLEDIESLVLLDKSRLEKFHIFMAGSEAGNSRVKISKIDSSDKYNRIRSGMKKFALDALIIAGGDDTGSVVVDLSKNDIPCIHAPKTMDLDLMTYSVGADSTINRIANLARDMRTTGETHNRIIVMEVFGRYAGHTAFRGGVTAEADAILIPEVSVDFDVVYNHISNLFFDRIKQNDNWAGSVLVLVAEGLRDASGNELIDKTAKEDSFGHRPLLGAGKYVVRELESRLQSDNKIEAFMKQTGQYVEKLYEIPEVREVRPGHLVRCGHTSAIDASFGLQVGAGAIELVRQSIFGVTISSYVDGEIEYMDCAEAIKQRFVSMKEINMYEKMGITFGRKPQDVPAKIKKIHGRPIRPY